LVLFFSWLTALSVIRSVQLIGPYLHYYWLVMAALHSRCGHYIFALWFLSLYFLSSPDVSSRRLDVYDTSTHDVALVRI